MPINVSGPSIKAIMAAGVSATKVMVGTGSTAVEAWSNVAWPKSGTWSGAASTGVIVTSSFTVSEAGWYVANNKLTVTSTGTAVMQAAVRINGSSVATGASLTSGPGVSEATMAARILQPGDVVELVYVSLSGAPSVIIDWSANFLGATLEDVYPISRTWTGSLGYSAEPDQYAVVDTHTVIDTGEFDVSLTVTGASNVSSAIYLNTATTPGRVTTTTSGATISGKVTANKGDVIYFVASNPQMSTANLSWTVDYAGPASVAGLLGLGAAKTTKYRVAFAGSSTMQGWNQPRYESVAHLLTARLVRHVDQANASQMVSRTTGSLAGPTLPGFHFLNAALGGTTSLNYLDTTKRNLVNGYGPDLLIHMVGSNDYSEQVAPATYKTRMKSAIQSITGVTKHLLVHQQRREDRSDTGYTWAQYGQALSELAAELPNVYFVDVSQAWHTLRNGATDWFAADKIHCTWKGSQGLATAIANAMQLDEHLGDTVWAFTPTELAAAATTISTLSSSPDSLVNVPATQSTTGARPSRTSSGTSSALSFAVSGARYLDTATWNAAYAFPLTFFVVVSARSTSTSFGTVVQPWFSRSINNDDGWWWAWQDRNVPEVRAALNSAFSGTFNYGFNNYPVIIAVHMAPNNRASIFVNSLTAKAVLDPDRIDENPGPWMKSLRIGANSSAASYTSSTLREMRFEHSNYDLSSVSTRMQQLATKYGVTLDP